MKPKRRGFEEFDPNMEASDLLPHPPDSLAAAQWLEGWGQAHEIHRQQVEYKQQADPIEKPDITISQLNAARAELEDLILEALQHFTRQTGMQVRRIEYQLLETVQTIGHEDNVAELRILL